MNHFKLLKPFKGAFLLRYLQLRAKETHGRMGLATRGWLKFTDRTEPPWPGRGSECVPVVAFLAELLFEVA